MKAKSLRQLLKTKNKNLTNRIPHRRELAQLARALALGARGSGFESRIPDHNFNQPPKAVFLLYNEFMELNFRLAVKAFIIDHGKLLLLKRRSNDVHKPGAWDIPGGRLEPGESPFDGLKREAQEEAGLDINIESPLDVHHFTRDDGQKITMIIFLCSLGTDREINLSEEHQEYKWVEVSGQDEIPAWLAPTIKNYQKYFEK